MKVSLMFGSQPEGLDDVARFATYAQSQGRRLWLGQSFRIDSHDVFSALAGRGIEVDTGLAVAVAPLRTPYDAALRARSVASLMNRPMEVAYGIGTQTAAEALLGRTLPRPGSYIREYVAAVRRLLAEEASELVPLPLYPLQAPQVRVGCGVLRPRMARIAGGVADFAVTWLVPGDHIATTLLPALEQGAAEAGRDRPRMVSVLQCGVARPGRVPARLAGFACAAHLQQPHYRAMMADAGIELPGHPAGDLRAAASAGLFAYGSAADIADEVARLHDLGVDEVVLNVGPVLIEYGAEEALGDVHEIFGAIGSRGLVGAGRAS